MATIQIPKILEMPEKLRPLILRINDFRYFLTEGGRGGGKTNAIARVILYCAEHKKLRIVCGREVQNSIAESVYSIFTDLITKNNLDFDIQANKIIHRRTGSTINFRGFRQQGAFNIQGLEGVDILWIDEAQAITKTTLDVLVPTIRKDKAKIFFSMNRHVENDPVYDFLIGRPDCLHIHINYYDNPFCTEALKTEAEECRKKSEKDYDHIWEGNPLSQAEDAVFDYQELINSVRNRHILAEGYGMRIDGYDIARYGDDKCACAVLQQQGALHWELIFIDEWDHKDLNYTTGRILTTSNEQGAKKSIIDEDGIGAGPLDTINKGRGIDRFVGFRNPGYSYKDNREYGNPRTANAFKARKMVSDGHLVITQEPVIKELCTLKYTYDSYQRKVLISKEKMRKDGVKSPNLADALIMAVSLIGEIRYEQDNVYGQRLPAYSKEEDLIDVSGLR